MPSSTYSKCTPPRGTCKFTSSGIASRRCPSESFGVSERSLTICFHTLLRQDRFKPFRGPVVTTELIKGQRCVCCKH